MNKNLVQSSHSLEMALPGTISSQAEQDEQDDAHLVKASQQGDQDAFAILVQKHQRRVFALAFRMLQDDEEASEITQEAFFAAWQGLPSFRGEARFPSWLYRIAYNCCLQQFELRKREHALRTAIHAKLLREGSDNEQQAADAIERHDWQTIVREQLEQLPTKYRLVLILRYLQDMTYEEMAGKLIMPIGTIKTHLFRARKLLKERLLAQHLAGPAL
jgi:RNA polymerase sigma-70 factor, ECF subfamily